SGGPPAGRSPAASCRRAHRAAGRPRSLRAPEAGPGDDEMNLAASNLTRALALLALAAPLAQVAHAAESAAPAEPPDTVRWESSVGDVEFAHRMHVEDLGTECVACHHETAAAALEVPHPDYFDDFWVDCATCHGGEAKTAL